MSLPPSPPGHWEYVTTTTYGSLTVITASAHGLSVGSVVSTSGGSYQITNAKVIEVVNSTTFKVGYSSSVAVSSSGGSTSPSAPSLVRNAGVTSATTSSAHNLKPGDMFSIGGVPNTIVGGGISAIAAASNIITVTTSAYHGVHSGDTVVISGVTTATYNGTWKVASVLSPTSFTINTANFVDGSSTGGNVYTEWNDDKLFVISVPNATSLTYRQAGPDALTTGIGTLIPVGQVDGGTRNAVMMFKTRSGYITSPSIPVKVRSAGGKKLIADQVPLGPSNVVARILAFTPINGGRWFYLGVPARDSAGNVISTSTVIDDNTSTTAMFDFSDESLMAGSAIDINGNNLFNLRLLGNCSTVSHYADRMVWGGDENCIQNLQNMGFEGGKLADGKPLAWTNPDGLVVNQNGDFGDAITVHGGQRIWQNAYRDYYGGEIFKPLTQYTFKCWAKRVGAEAVTVVADLYDTVTATIIETASIGLISASPTTMFYSAAFTSPTPAVITPTTVFRIYAGGSTTAAVILDECRVVFTASPWEERTLFGSYVINPESVDDLTGRISASSGDQSAIMDTFQLMDPRAITEESANARLYFLTKNRLHTTKNLRDLEPSKWAVNQIADVCGAASMFSAVTGESWAMWASQDGVRVFDGGTPRKVTQEIQDLWKSINQSALGTIWGVNDTENRRVYFGVPIGASTVPNRLIVLDHRYGEAADDIASRDSVKVSAYSGQMLVTDLSRKYTHWHINAQCGAFLETPHGKDLVLGDVNGRSYYLDATKLQDDDYGRIPAYYVTNFGPSDEQEQSLRLGPHRKLTTFMSLFIEGVGNLKITPYRDSLANPSPNTRLYPLRDPLPRAMEIPQNIDAQRVAYKIEALPISPSLDAHFDLSSLTISVIPHPHSAVAGRR